MKKALSLPCRYKVSLDTFRNSYQFSTSGQARYEVLFTLSNEILSGTHLDGADVYHIVMNKIIRGDGKRDIEVARTVDAIVNHFFLIKNRIFFYTCDSLDQRHFTRFRLFNMWYTKSILQKRLAKVDFKLMDEGLIYYASFVYDRDHDLGEDKVLESFDTARQVLQEYK